MTEDFPETEAFEFTHRELALVIFSLGRLDNLMGLLATQNMSNHNFTKDECRNLARKLGAKIVVGNLDE